MEHVIGIDLGGTNLQVGVVDGGNRIVGRARRKSEAARGLDGVIENIVAGVQEACVNAGVALPRIAAIGIAAAGAIDVPRGVVLEAPNLKWHNVPLRQLLEKRLGRPVTLDNDVNGAVWGEYCLGAGRAVKGDVGGVWVGTGVGGGLVLMGKLYQGDFFTAGEIGHTILRPEGSQGGRSVEDLCSRTGLIRIIEARRGEHPKSILASGALDMPRLAEAYKAKDALALAVIDESARLMGIAIANMVTLLSLKTVILGGGVTEALGDSYFAAVRKGFDGDVFPPTLRACELRMTRLAADSGLLGAALLARERLTAEKVSG